jgi:Formate hydrogenlyase subunit 6/NADH:ubiquinone oxidoreductase 23 kD subunit (chain I)
VYRAVVFFFSGTGNTWWVADRIKKQLDAKGINADTVSVDALTPKKADWWIKTADLVLFGWPVHNSDMPGPMKRFVNSLPVVEKGKHIHIFCTQSAFSGDGAWHYHRHFEEKGLIIDSAEHFIMPSNRNGNGSDRHFAAIMERCGKSVERYADRLLSGQAHIRGRRSGWMGGLQRAPYKIAFGRLQKRVRIDADKCTGCGLCAQLCPAQNIRMDGKAVPLDHCALCMRCVAFCPADAIGVPGSRSPYALHDKRFKAAIFK